MFFAVLVGLTLDSVRSENGQALAFLVTAHNKSSPSQLIRRSEDPSYRTNGVAAVENQAESIVGGLLM